jgi:hypothetical protein
MQHKKAYEFVTTGKPCIGIPCATVYSLFRALPGAPGFLATVACKLPLAGLISASGYQDHTASPSAPVSHAMRTSGVHRIHPAFRGDREPPLIGMKRADHLFDLGWVSSKISEKKKNGAC